MSVTSRDLYWLNYIQNADAVDVVFHVAVGVRVAVGFSAVVEAAEAVEVVIVVVAAGLGVVMVAVELGVAWAMVHNLLFLEKKTSLKIDGIQHTGCQS